MKRASGAGDIRNFFVKSAQIDRNEQSTSAVEETSRQISIIQSSCSLNRIVDEFVSDLDIGHAVEANLEPNKRYQFLKNAWKPPVNYEFPTRCEKKHNRKFQRDWLSKYEWLSYSKLKEGGFCKYCVLFAPSGGGVGFQVRFYFFLFLYFYKGVKTN